MIWSADAPMLLSFLPMVLSERSTSLPVSGIRFVFWSPAPSSWKSKTAPTSPHLPPTSSHFLLPNPTNRLRSLLHPNLRYLPQTQQYVLLHVLLLTLLYAFQSNQFRILLRVQLDALLPNPTTSFRPILHINLRYLLLTHQHLFLIPISQFHQPSFRPRILAPLTVATSSAKRKNSSDSVGIPTQDPQFRTKKCNLNHLTPRVSHSNPTLLIRLQQNNNTKAINLPSWWLFFLLIGFVSK